MNAEAKPHVGMAHRIGHEFIEYAILSLYLYICFGAILLDRVSVLHAHGIAYAPYGLAAIKALLLAKFMLIGRVIHIGERYRYKPLIYPVLYQSFVVLAFLVVLTVIEEAVTGLIHGRAVTESISEIAGGTGLQIVATCVLLWLILLPYCAFRQISEILGEGKLRQIFFVGETVR